MIPMSSAQARNCEHWFPQVADTALLSALQGHMGTVMADCPEDIHLLVARCGDYFYFGGDPMHPQAEDCIRQVPEEGYLVSNEPCWKARFLQVLGARAEVQHRFIIGRDMTRLDKAHLRSLFAQLPEGFALQPVTAEMAETLRTQAWSYEYLHQFESAEDFAKRGFGFAVTKGEDIACVGCTFSLYDQGVEMGIATHPGYRKLGLATIAASRMVLEALERGLELNWDAANPISLRLAEKMGFTKVGEYDLVLVKA